MTKELRKKDIKEIRLILKQGKSELNLKAKEKFIEVYGYISYRSIRNILKAGYMIYHSKLNNSAMVIYGR